MPNATEQSTERSRRGALVILFVVAAIGVGLWFALERPKLAEPADDARPAAGDAQTTVSGTTATTTDPQTADSGAASTTTDAQTTVAGAASTATDTQAPDSGAASTADDAQAAVADAASSTGDAPTSDSGATSLTADAQAGDSGAASTADDAQARDSGAAATAADSQTTLAGADSSTGDAQTAVSGATSLTAGAQAGDSSAASLADDAQTTASGAASPTADLQTAGTGTTASQEPPPPADPDATGDATRVAAADPGTAPVDETPRVSAAPDSAIERTPVDAPSDAEAGGAGVLAAVERVIDRIETTIEEGLDSVLEVQVTYDDSQADAPEAEAAPTEAARATDSDTTLAAGGTQVPDSDVGDDTSIAGSPGSGDAASSDAATTVATATDAATTDATTTDATTTDATTTDATTTDATTTDVAMADDSTTTTATGSAEAEAKEYVETLTDTAPQTIPVDKADHFVTPERVISLVPEDTIESVSVDQLASDETLSPDTPITVVREVEQIEAAAAEQLIADAGGDLDKKLRVQVTYDDAQDETGSKVVEEDDVQRITVREALERIRTEPDKPLPVIKTVRYFEVMTLKELLDGAAGEDAFLSVVTRPYRIESATLADLLERQQAENPGTIFYLHTVLPTDEQGIWGIVHFGIIDNFARGMAIRRGEDIETYTVRIPRHADERLADRSSSFLGLLIDRKTKESYVYNFRDDRMGRNPDRIFPGQELVIIHFKPEELMAIYKHFVAS